jgi:hypothetical protein
MGLTIGRCTDHLVRKVILGKATLAGNEPWHKRASWFFDRVRAQKITRLAPQIAVQDKNLGIRTSIDVIGRDHKNRVVVIELKTTQDTIAQHQKRYFSRCQNCPVLSNGLPNTEFWRHQLQCGFGMLCKDTHMGLVVVVCSDGAVHYPVSSTACDRRMFRWPHTDAAQFTSMSPSQTIAWPSGADASLRAALNTAGFSTVVTTDPIVVKSTRLGLAAAIIVHKPATYKKSRLAANHRTVLRTLVKQVFKAQPKNSRAKTRGLTISLQRGGGWCIEKTGALLKQ